MLTGLVAAALLSANVCAAQIAESRAMVCEELAFAWAEYVWTVDADDPPMVQEYVYETCTAL
jgi:hypothetical protein